MILAVTRGLGDGPRYPACLPLPSKDFDTWWNRFKTTGDICPVRLGMSRDDLRSILGDPDDMGGTSRKHRTPVIWKYSDLEFHFGLGNDGKLELIYMEKDEVVKISISSHLNAG